MLQLPVRRLRHGSALRWPPSARSTSSRSAWGRPARTRSGHGARPSVRCSAGRSSASSTPSSAVQVDLYGSLAKTGRGHMTDMAVMLGLLDDDPVTCDTAAIPARIDAIRRSRTLALGGRHPVRFDPADRLPLQRPDQSPAPSQRPDVHRRAGGRLDASRRRTTPSAAASSSRRARPTRAGPPSRCPFPIESARRPARPLRHPRPDHPGGRAAERAGLAHAGGDPAGPRGDLERDEGVRLPRLPHRAASCPAGSASSGAPPGSAARMLGAGSWPDVDSWIAAIRSSRPAFQETLDVGELLRAGGERGERRVRPGGDGADQRGRGRGPGGAAVLPLLLRRRRERRRALPAHRRRDRQHLQEGGDDLRGDGRLPGGDRRLQRDGGGGAGPVPRRLGRRRC